MKNIVLLSLLAIGSVAFASHSPIKDYRELVDQFNKDYKKIIDQRNKLKENGTPSEKAAIRTTDLAINAVSVATTLGICSYGVDAILSSFQVTKEIPHRGTIATGSCATLYAALYASFKNEEMQKSKGEQKSFYDWLVSWVK